MATKLEIKIIVDDKDKTKIKGFGTELGGLGKIAGGVMTAGLAVGTAAVGALATGIGFSIGEAIEAQEVQAQLGAVLKSTGGIAGVSAEEATSYADSLTQVTRYSDEAILSAENLLLTFTNIRDDVFPGATEIVLDMSTALGTDLTSSATMVGKALQDPILGVTALRRVGVNFSEAQTEVIRKLVETGKAAEAQALILEELQTEFGGSARAAGETFAGELDILKNSASNVAEGIGTELIPELTELAQEVGPELIGLFQDLSEDAIPAAVEVFADFVELMVDGIETAALLAKWHGAVNAALEEQEERLIAGADGYEDYVKGMEDAADAAHRQAGTEEQRNRVLGAGVTGTKQYNDWVVIMTESEYKAAVAHQQAQVAIDGYIASQNAGIKSTRDFAGAHTEDFIPAVDESAESVALLDEQLGRIEFMLSDPLGEAYDDFVERNQELKGKVGELEGQIAELEEKEYLTAAQKEELADLRGELADSEQAIADLAAAHEEATKKILFGILQQQLATDGWTTEELRLLGTVGERWGLLSDEAGETFDEFGQAMTDWANGESYVETLAALDALAEKTSGIAGTYSVNFVIKVTGDEIPSLPSGPTGKGIPGVGFAHGGQMVVPPGFYNDDFLIGVSSGELVDVRTPQQQQEGRRRGAGNVINNYNVGMVMAQPTPSRSLFDEIARVTPPR